jgi:hypothetical protein
MAEYTITTTDDQEAGLQFSFEHYNYTNLASAAELLQSRVSAGVLDPMVAEQKRANSVAVNDSISTIPPENMPTAVEEIKTVIINNGGTLVEPGAPVILPPPPNTTTINLPPPGHTTRTNSHAGLNRGIVPVDRRKGGDSFQAGEGDEESLPADRPDGK